ncbi:MAG: alanine/glycine:cation symporter family protein [Rhodothalassiaceae bacterium]
MAGFLQSAILALAAAMLAPATGAEAVVTAQCDGARSVAQRINDAVAPVTDFVSGIIFMEIPLKAAQPVSHAELRFGDTRPHEGDLVTLSLGGRSVTYETDRDGIVCEGHRALALNGGPVTTAGRLAAMAGEDFAEDGLGIIPDGAVLALRAPTAAAPAIMLDAKGILATDFADGSLGFPFIVLWLICGALFFTLRMKFINFRAFRHAIEVASGKYDDPKDPGEVSHFQALTAALSGTVGLGNIAGVAIAISIGGPGATFWMILAGLFGMTSKFTECTLGVKYRKIDAEGIVSGGPMYYLSRGLAKRGLGGLGRVLAVIFALLCIGGSFGAGNMFQVNQSTQQFMDVMVPWLFGEGSFMAGKPWIVGAVYAIFVGMVIIGGIRSITRVTERLVPLMAFVYISAALVILGSNLEHIPAAFGAIFAGAFLPQGVAGGIVGVLVQGMRRASFSNEAGVGSAAIAHSAVKTTEPVSEGMVALLEPFIDTVVICTMTALVIIITGMYQEDGIALTSAAFATVIDWFPIVLSVAVLLFAFSTSITWYYYGERSFLYLVGTDRKRAELMFKLGYLVVVIIGSSMQLTSVMDFADAMVLAMAFPNMIGLYIMSGEVKRMLDSYRARVRSGEIRPYVAPAEAAAE